jgi:TetR/AcrR family transcriptional regulator, cholesterol catabolism regulator
VHDAPPRRRRVRARVPTARALEREQEIYDVAAEILNKKGYAATTLQEIATAVGLLKGSLYYYIDSKGDLLYRITRKIHDEALSNLAATRAATGPAADRLHLLVERHVRSFGRQLTSIRVFYTENAALPDERRREIMADRRTYESFVCQLLEEGIADGSFCPAIDVRIISNAILTMINSVYVWYRPDRDDAIEAVATAYADYVVAGLRCAGAHSHGCTGSGVRAH